MSKDVLNEDPKRSLFDPFWGFQNRCLKRDPKMVVIFACISNGALKKMLVASEGTWDFMSPLLLMNSGQKHSKVGLCMLHNNISLVLLVPIKKKKKKSISHFENQSSPFWGHQFRNMVLSPPCIAAILSPFCGLFSGYY